MHIPIFTSHTSCVHATPSSQTVLSATFSQPAVGLQLSAVHSTPSSHNASSGTPLQPPTARQTVSSSTPSLTDCHRGVVTTGDCTRCPGCLTPSSQDSHHAFPQPVTPSQVSRVHSTPSSQTVLLATFSQPAVGLQLSEVHSTPSSHKASSTPLQPSTARQTSGNTPRYSTDCHRGVFATDGCVAGVQGALHTVIARRHPLHFRNR